MKYARLAGVVLIMVPDLAECPEGEEPSVDPTLRDAALADARGMRILLNSPDEESMTLQILLADAGDFDARTLLETRSDAGVVMRMGPGAAPEERRIAHLLDELTHAMAHVNKSARDQMAEHPELECNTPEEASRLRGDLDSGVRKLKPTGDGKN